MQRYRIPGEMAPLRRPWIGLLVLLLTACAVGSGVRAIALRDLDGKRILPFEAAPDSYHVFLFTRTDCPISNRYAPLVQRLDEKYRSRGIRIWLVYLDRDQPSEEIRSHLEEYGYDLAALRDDEHRLAEAAGALVTPEAAVYLPDGSLVYRGRIDNRYAAYGKARPEATVNDLADVLEALAEGRTPQTHTTEAVGCLIPDLK